MYAGFMFFPQLKKVGGVGVGSRMIIINAAFYDMYAGLMFYFSIKKSGVGLSGSVKQDTSASR